MAGSTRAGPPMKVGDALALAGSAASLKRESGTAHASGGHSGFGRKHESGDALIRGMLWIPPESCESRSGTCCWARFRYRNQTLALVTWSLEEGSSPLVRELESASAMPLKEEPAAPEWWSEFSLHCLTRGESTAAGEVVKCTLESGKRRRHRCGGRRSPG